MKKGIYLIVTDVPISSVRDLKKLEKTDLATITDLDIGCGWETFNATQPQAQEVLPIVLAAHTALALEGMLTLEI